MAHYANAKGGVPFHKREEERRWKEHLKHHKKMLKQTKPTITGLGQKVEYVHVQLKLKRLQLQEDRLSTIEYENRKLLEKIVRQENRIDNQTWNTLYNPPGEQTKNRQTRKDEEEEKATEERRSSYSEDDDDDDDSVFSADTPDIIRSVRTNERKTVNDEKRKLRQRMDSQKSHASNESSSEQLKRDEVRKRLGGDTMVNENTKLQRRLSHILQTLELDEELDDEMDERRMERKRAIEEAKEAVRKENELLYDTSEKQKKQNEYDERIEENIRLNKKLKQIKRGKGRRQPNDPEYNGLDRWWVTSPRGREKSEYEEEKKQMLEDISLKREQRKQERLNEEKRILKKKKEEKKKKQNEVPSGYRKKKRKKTKAATEPGDEEELPDTSFVKKDSYDDVDEENSDAGR